MSAPEIRGSPEQREREGEAGKGAISLNWWTLVWEEGGYCLKVPLWTGGQRSSGFP